MKPVQEVLLAIDKVRIKGKFLTKEDIGKILEATKAITIHKDIVHTLLLFLNTLPSKTEISVNSLTSRELDILRLVGRAMHNKDIAMYLGIKTSTVETHRKNIIKKLGLAGKGKLLEFAILYNLQPEILEIS